MGGEMHGSWVDRSSSLVPVLPDWSELIYGDQTHTAGGLEATQNVCDYSSLENDL